MKPRNIFVIAALAFAVLAASCWFYVRATRYEIVSQKSYSGTLTGKTATRGYAVRSLDELMAALKEHGVAQSDFHGSVSFNKGFVFIVENGSLLEIYRGDSGFDIAAVRPSTNLSVAVVHGPKSRPLKAVAR
jgi:hypothetical protein